MSLKIKTKGTDVPGMEQQLLMSASLLFGTDPATDDCVTARRLACEPKTTRNSCKD